MKELPKRETVHARVARLRTLTAPPASAEIEVEWLPEWAAPAPRFTLAAPHEARRLGRQAMETGPTPPAEWTLALRPPHPMTATAFLGPIWRRLSEPEAPVFYGRCAETGSWRMALTEDAAAQPLTRRSRIETAEPSVLNSAFLAAWRAGPAFDAPEESLEATAERLRDGAADLLRAVHAAHPRISRGVAPIGLETAVSRAHAICALRAPLVGFTLGSGGLEDVDMPALGGRLLAAGFDVDAEDMFRWRAAPDDGGAVLLTAHLESGPYADILSLDLDPIAAPAPRALFNLLSSLAFHIAGAEGLTLTRRIGGAARVSETAQRAVIDDAIARLAAFGLAPGAPAIRQLR